MSQFPAKPSAPRRPLHQQIYAQLRREIAADFKPGDILPSQNELAKRFGVSFLTVREALSILSEEGVIVRRRGHDTTVVDPAGNQHVAVLIEQDIAHPRTSYFFRRLPQALRTILREQGLRVRLYAGLAVPGEDNDHLFEKSPSTCPEFLEDLNAGRIQAVIIVGGTSNALVHNLRNLRIPFVGQDRSVEYRVSLDPDELTRMGIDHLIAQGRRNLAFMSWGNPSVILRHARERGLDLNIDWIRCDLPPAAPGAGWDEFREIWSAGRNKPDGLLITDGVLFGDALHAMIEAHVRVPNDLMVVTHDTVGSPFWAPFPVTRIFVDPIQMALDMSRMLVDLVNHRQPDPAQVSTPLIFDDPDSPDGPGRRDSAAADRLNEIALLESNGVAASPHDQRD
jgi:DNA-binding LacI/PurR family transcriptional regulator